MKIFAALVLVLLFSGSVDAQKAWKINSILGLENHYPPGPAMEQTLK